MFSLLIFKQEVIYRKIALIFLMIILAQYIVSIIFAPRKGRIAQLDRAPAF